MAKAHGKLTVITVATKDISPYTKTSQYERSGKAHDTTGYGLDDETYEGGLRGGKFTCGGRYDNTASVGPRNAMHAIVSTKIVVTRKVEGTGTGKPLDTFDAVLLSYVETNPHDDLIDWSAEFQISGPVVTTVQP